MVKERILKINGMVKEYKNLVNQMNESQIPVMESADLLCLTCLLDAELQILIVELQNELETMNKAKIQLESLKDKLVEDKIKMEEYLQQAKTLKGEMNEKIQNSISIFIDRTQGQISDCEESLTKQSIIIENQVKIIEINRSTRNEVSEMMRFLA